MKKLYYLLLLLLISSPALTQSTLFSRAKILLNDTNESQLAAQGIDITHGLYAKGRFFISDLSAEEIDRLEEAGYEIEILIEDVQAHYLAQNQGDQITTRDEECFSDSGDYPYVTPENFALGSMGGFLTYQEMLENLDAMATQYPDLISTRQPIEGQPTLQGRPIYWVRLSDNPNTDEVDEPEVFYNSLHHSREPNSLSQLIFYMWYMLENYETDPEVQFLVDNTEMYFVPCINVDGYLYNEQTNPDGGGLWRKNRRDNEDGSFGVDLNRNYGYFWGHDDFGSSPEPSSQVYRGTEAFSEPETQAIKAFCEDHEFQIALNYHTYGNLLIYPYAYSDQPTEEGPLFNAMAELMTLQNNYFAGTGLETVGYPVNGSSDDWMYGEMETKEKIYSMTPEVGSGGFSGGFWPPSSQIENNCKGTMFMNLSVANLVHVYGQTTELSDRLLSSPSGAIDFQVKRYGLKDGEITISLSPVSENIISVDVPESFDLEILETATGSINYELNPDIEEGEEVVFLLSTDNGDYVHSDTIRKIYLTEPPAFTDDIATDDNWTVGLGDWGLTNLHFYSEPYSMADSPFGDYEGNTFSLISQSEAIDLADVVEVKVTFWARWDIESNFDYAQVQGNMGTTGFFPLCGKYTVEGGFYQDNGQPVYEGFQDQWVQEEIDLTEYLYLGDEMRLRFAMFSDNGDNRDGYFFDDVQVITVTDESSSVYNLSPKDFVLQSRPNPATNYTLIEFDPIDQAFNTGRLVVFNSLGQAITEHNLQGQQKHQVRLDTKNWEAGIYYYQILTADGHFPAQKLVVLGE